MTAPTDVTFSAGTTITSEWLNGVNDHVNNLEAYLPEIGTYALLRAYDGPVTAFLVRGVADIFDGGFGVFRVDAADTTTADNGGTVLVDASGRRWKREYSGAVNVKWFGARGDGSTNDTASIQAAIDSLGAAGGTVDFVSGKTYRIARSIGTNDRWGIKITASNVRLRGNGATLRRYDTDISTYALAYPIVFVGTPDSDVAVATENVVIDGFKFIGENTQHASSGSALKDFRDAIHAKNTKNLVVQNNTFTAVDSAVITYQSPAAYDYVNSVYYNTTKNYNSKFINNTCIATPHAVVGRALIHAVTAIGVDTLLVDGNYFEWCDCAVASNTTYDLGTVETNTFTPVVSGWSLGAVKRTGCGVVVSNNVMHNCSEHPIYLTGFEEVVSANKITSDQPSITATNDPVKVRSYGCVISGNYISGYGAAITCAPGALNVSITGNTIYIPSSANFDLGAISVNSAGISAYLAPRIAMGFLSGYRQMSGITICGNSVNFQEAAVSPANTRRDVAFNVLSSTSDANYPNGQLVGVSISGNAVKNYQVGIHVTGLMFKNVVVTGNAFFAKPFTEAAFNGSTTMNTRCAVQVSRDSTAQLLDLSFSGNSIYGCQYLWASRDGGGSAGTIYHPTLFNDNSLRFIQNTGTADFIQIGASPSSKFNNNTGISFLSRSWGGYAIGNNLYADQGNTDNQARKQSFAFLGGTMRFYTDDSGTYVTL